MFFKMNLELDVKTGALFVNKSEFVFYDENYISNNLYLKKHFMVNGFDTYGFEVCFYGYYFSLNVIFKNGDFVRCFLLTFDGDCCDNFCLKKQLSKLSGLIERKINVKPNKGEWKTWFELKWGGIELNAIRQDYLITMKIYYV